MPDIAKIKYKKTKKLESMYPLSEDMYFFITIPSFRCSRQE